MLAGLTAILNPVSTGTFFAEYWTKQFLHIPGPPDKLVHLYSWDALNRTLEEHRFGSKRLGIVKGAQGLDASRYLSTATGQVDASRMAREFAGGATIILNQCEETHPPLRELCADLERLFHVNILVNLYATCGTDDGFDIHWDEQDTLILQIAGRKHWRVWAPTREDPFKDDVVDTSPATRPSGPPIWDNVLEQGGVLSMPRGWWHVASPIGEPSLHLTVTIKSLNGVDLLQWFANQMKTSATARMSLPVMQSDEARRQWLQELWDALNAAWSDDLMERHLADSNRHLRVRPSLCLPLTEASSGTTPSSTTGRHRPVRRDMAGRAQIAADGDGIGLLKRLRSRLSGAVSARHH